MQPAMKLLDGRDNVPTRRPRVLTTACACVECANFNRRSKEMVMEICPCGSGKDYVQCCSPYIQGTQVAPTAEALMRSRYSAYATSEIDYIYKPTHPSQRSKFNR